MVSDRFPYTFSVYADYKSPDGFRRACFYLRSVLPALPEDLRCVRKRLFCRTGRIPVRISYGSQSNGGSAEDRQNYQGGGTVSAFFLQQYQSGFYYKFYRVENTGHGSAPPALSCRADGGTGSPELSFPKVLSGKRETFFPGDFRSWGQIRPQDRFFSSGYMYDEQL